MLVNAKQPPERHEAAERRQRHPLEEEIDALIKRADPVPEEVVNAARHAFDRRWHAWGSDQPSDSNGRGTDDTPAGSSDPS